MVNCNYILFLNLEIHQNLAPGVPIIFISIIDVDS